MNPETFIRPLWASLSASAKYRDLRRRSTEDVTRDAASNEPLTSLQLVSASTVAKDITSSLSVTVGRTFCPRTKASAAKS